MTTRANTPTAHFGTSAHIRNPSRTSQRGRTTPRFSSRFPLYPCSRCIRSSVHTFLHFGTDARYSFWIPLSVDATWQGVQLRKHIDATLGSGNLREAVSLPPGEDLNEWLAVNSEKPDPETRSRNSKPNQPTNRPTEPTDQTNQNRAKNASSATYVRDTKRFSFSAVFRCTSAILCIGTFIVLAHLSIRHFDFLGTFTYFHPHLIV